MTLYGRSPAISKRPVGHRLSDAQDPATRLAMTRKCPTCEVEPDRWCRTVSGPRTGRLRGRLHYTRAEFLQIGPNGQPVRT